MMKILYIIELVIFMAADIMWILRTDEKKFKFILISALSLLICGSILFIKDTLNIYAFLITGIVTLFNMIVMYDIKTKYIPNILLLVLNVIGLATSFFVPSGMFLKSIIGAWMITGLCFLVGRKAKGGIGTGDLFCMSGLMMSMNFSGMMNFMFSSLFLSVIYGIGALIFKKKTLKSEMPFAPFLLSGYLIMILCS